ncbi:tRNA glutamyl-Q(34) synthetase GluQRS [Sulfuricystis multivorans]|uniref:tRNA glutamyl-Q(34) synthetase GluQRS n=1 Tax=Sulfuricystis multivorans TaxID=2211108 RepID=UPI000F8177F2|nr:tRNA glutamyl-Q(34) synthetase GluQRS [Sulfuricystis multivorans]
MTRVTTSSCGRFAPSPTGPLHFGSLIAALGSCLEAKARGGTWLVRIEDVDRPRCRPEYAAEILRTLEAFGFEWDGEVLVQSRRTARYREVLETLQRQGAVYPCGCTRAELAAASPGVDGAPVYPGTCREGLPPGKKPRAWRLRVSGAIDFVDLVQGPQHQDLAREVGDCVLLRADGLFAYQLAVVVDDADQGVDHVVRGADLIHSTGRQIFLQRLLGLPTPQYAHLPVAVDATGAKLSKQTKARPIEARDAPAALIAAARFLGLNPPASLCRATSAEFWRWAREHWSLARVPKQVSAPIPDNPRRHSA